MYDRDLYMPGPDGTMFQITRDLDGTTTATPVTDPEAKFIEVTEKDLSGNVKSTGWYHLAQDIEEAKKQAEDNSHRLFFGIEENEKDPAKIKQRFRRVDQLQSLLTQITMDRMSPVGIPQVRYVKDEMFMDLMNMYKKATLDGKQKDCEFQPLNTYMHKLVLKTGKQLRPVLVGEVGMIGPEILCLEQGYGGTVFSVSAAISRDQEEQRKAREAEAAPTTQRNSGEDWEYADEEEE